VFARAVQIIFLKVVALAVAEWASSGTRPSSLSWACSGALLVSAPLQLYLLNMTLASGKATFTIPLYLSLTMILTSASGGILFSEFAAVARRAPAPLWLVVYGCAVLVVLVGLVFLSSKQEAKAARQRTAERPREHSPTAGDAEATGADAASTGRVVVAVVNADGGSSAAVEANDADDSGSCCIGAMGASRLKRPQSEARRANCDEREPSQPPGVDLLIAPDGSLKLSDAPREARGKKRTKPARPPRRQPSAGAIGAAEHAPEAKGIAHAGLDGVERGASRGPSTPSCHSVGTSTPTSSTTPTQTDEQPITRMPATAAAGASGGADGNVEA